MLVLDERRAAIVRDVCDAFVPGSARVGPEVYIDALLARMAERDRQATINAFEALEPAVSAGTSALAERMFTPEFMTARALACEAFYSDFVAPGAAGPGA